MSALFTPVGEKARWVTCYEMVERAKPGAGITYAQVQKALGGVPRQVAQQAMLQAKDRLEKDGKRTVINARNFGWTVAHADQHLDEDGRYLSKAVRQVRRRLHVLGSAQNLRSELTPEQQRDLDFRQSQAALQNSIVSRNKKPFEELLTAHRSAALPGIGTSRG